MAKPGGQGNDNHKSQECEMPATNDNSFRARRSGANRSSTAPGCARWAASTRCASRPPARFVRRRLLDADPGQVDGSLERYIGGVLLSLDSLAADPTLDPLP